MSTSSTKTIMDVLENIAYNMSEFAKWHGGTEHEIDAFAMQELIAQLKNTAAAAKNVGRDANVPSLAECNLKRADNSQLLLELLASLGLSPGQ